MQYAVFSQKISEFSSDGQEKTGWKEKRKEVGREEWEEKNEISIFSRGVFL